MVAYRSAARVALFAARTPPKIPPCTKHPPLPPVIMLHGVLASHSTYASIIKRKDFVADREIIALDLRNHGKSPHLPVHHGMRYEHMALDVADFLHTHQIPKASLIGHSMGGKVAMQLALSHPHLVAQLVVVDIAPVTYADRSGPADPFTAVRAMSAIDLSHFQTRAQIDEALRAHGVASLQVRQFVMTNLKHSSNSSSKYEWKLNLPAIHAALNDISAFPPHDRKTFGGPTCLIRGGKSDFVPFQAMKLFVSLFPNTKLVTLSDAGHWLQAQAPDQFCRSVNDFLAR